MVLLSDHCASRQPVLFAWLAAAERKDTERKRAELARFSHLSICLSHSVAACVALAFSPPLAVERWFVNAKFKLSRAALVEPSCDANEDTNTSTLSKSLSFVLVFRELPPKRRNEHTNEPGR